MTCVRKHIPAQNLNEAKDETKIEHAQQVYLPFILLYSREETLLADVSLLPDSSVVVPAVSESTKEDVVLVLSVDVTVRCHDGMPGGAGVEPTMGDGNCFLCKTQ